MGSTLTSGMSATVTSGQTVDGTTVDSGATFNVDFGGYATGTSLFGGIENVDGVDSGLVGSNTAAQSISVQDIRDGGISYNATFINLALQEIDSGGLAVSATIVGALDPNDLGGDYSNQVINQGGTALDTLLDVGGLETIYGTAINTSATGRGNNIIVSGTLVYSAVNAQVSATMGGEGLIEVTGGGTRVTISDVDQGTNFGTAFNGAALIGSTTVLELGTPDSLQSGTILFDPAGDATLEIEGNTSPTETMANFVSGNEIILDGTVISGAQVSDGLVQLFLTNGTEDDIRIADAHDGGIEIINGANSTILRSDLVPTIFNDGDDVTSDVTDFELQDGTTVSIDNAAAAGGYFGSATLNVVSGGSSTQTYVNSGGVENLVNGSSQQDHFLAGATQMVGADGISSDPVFAGGMLIDNGAVQFGFSGNSPASARLYTVSGGGAISAANGTLTLSGDASNFTGAITIGAGGTVEVSSNASLGTSASLDFDGGLSDPTIQIDAALNNLPQAVISGFTTSADVIDLRALAGTVNTTSTSYTAYDKAEVTSGGTILTVTSGGSIYTLNLDSATTGSGPLNLIADGNGGTDITFSVLSAGTASELNSQLFQATTLSSGTYTAFLTSNITLTSDDGGTDSLNPLLAENGATVVLDGEGFSISVGDGGSSQLLAEAGPLVVTSLGGSIALDVISGAHLTVASNTFGGIVYVTSGVLEVADSSGAGTAVVSFNPADGGHQYLRFDNAALPADGGIFSNNIDDFATMSGQYIDLAGFTFSSGTTSATLSHDGSTLTVTNGGRTAEFALAGTPVTALNVFDDANGGTIVTADSVACYVTGTRILTETGERPVEDLAIGENVVTASGAKRAVRWVGYRSYRGRFLAGRPGHMPVRIAAGALADGVPARDLYVSPKHAMFLDGLLVPAAALVNGDSITHVPSMEEIGYWHIELETHDVLLAEGAPSESFVDDGSRGIFHNQAEFAARYPDAPRGNPAYCAPRVEQGVALEAIRTRLAARCQVAHAA